MRLQSADRPVLAMLKSRDRSSGGDHRPSR